MTTAHRPLSAIAADIRKDWGAKTNYGAKPYLDAMLCLDSMSDMYGADPASMIVAYFLCNSGSYKGEKAKGYKAELRAMSKK